MEAGVQMGLTREVSRTLVVETMLGSAALLKETGSDPEALRAMVTSPAGTTAAGIRTLEARAVRSAFMEAVAAATDVRATCSAEGAKEPVPNDPVRTVFFLSDFGTRDEFVGVVHAVIERRAPGTMVIDLTHHVPPFDVRAGSHTLVRAVPHLGAGVVLGVVDPGVGTSRRGVALEVRRPASGGRCASSGPTTGSWSWWRRPPRRRRSAAWWSCAGTSRSAPRPDLRRA